MMNSPQAKTPRAERENDWTRHILPVGIGAVALIFALDKAGIFADPSAQPQINTAEPVEVIETVEGGSHIVSPNVTVDDPDFLLVRQDGIERMVVVSPEVFQEAQELLEEGTPVTTILGSED